MIDVKCKACDKLLLKAIVFVGAIKCSRCKMIFEFSIWDSVYFDKKYDKIGLDTTECKQ